MPFLAQRQKLQWKFWTQKEVFFWSSSWNQERSWRHGCWLTAASVLDNTFKSKCVISCQESRLHHDSGFFILVRASCGFPPARSNGCRKSNKSVARLLFFFLSVCCSHQGGNNVGENLSTIIFPQSLQGCNYLPLLKSALRAEHWSPHCSVTRETLRKEGMGEK